MMAHNLKQNQRGVALVVSLLFLVIVTIISITAATNSSQGLKMASNMQDSYNSFQSAEAGVLAALALAGTSDEPFTRKVVVLPFAGMTGTDHPLWQLRDGAASVDTQVFLTAAARPCPRPPNERGGSSVGTFDCDYYRIESGHDMANRARTKVQLGIVKTVIGENG